MSKEMKKSIPYVVLVLIFMCLIPHIVLSIPEMASFWDPKDWAQWQGNDTKIALSYVYAALIWVMIPLAGALISFVHVLRGNTFSPLLIGAGVFSVATLFFRLPFYQVWVLMCSVLIMILMETFGFLPEQWRTEERQGSFWSELTLEKKVVIGAFLAFGLILAYGAIVGLVIFAVSFSIGIGLLIFVGIVFVIFAIYLLHKKWIAATEAPSSIKKELATNKHVLLWLCFLSVGMWVIIQISHYYFNGANMLRGVSWYSLAAILAVMYCLPILFFGKVPLTRSSLILVLVMCAVSLFLCGGLNLQITTGMNRLVMSFGFFLFLVVSTVVSMPRKKHN